MTASDEELMARYCDGDAAAFETLYRRHRGPLFRYLSRLAPPGADAESLYQDAWLRVIQARAQWRRDKPFRPWLYRIAHNHLIDRLRRDAHLHPADDQEIAELPASGIELDVMELLRDCVERLLTLLARLPEVQRSAFLLKEEAGLTLEQIGEVTGVGRETVKSRLRYALNRLRQGLEGCND